MSPSHLRRDRHLLAEVERWVAHADASHPDDALLEQLRVYEQRVSALRERMLSYRRHDQLRRIDRRPRRQKWRAERLEPLRAAIDARRLSMQRQWLHAQMLQRATIDIVERARAIRMRTRALIERSRRCTAG